MDFQHYPFLTQDEFTDACHHFEHLYDQAPLNPSQREWKLRLCTTLDMTLSSKSGYLTYLQITRPLQEMADPRGVSLDLTRMSVSETVPQHLLGGDDMMEAEESDTAVISKKSVGQDFGHVTYEIHLHPTYRVPCLWFTLHHLPPNEIAFHIDTVFRHLVPDEHKDSLRRGMGGIGGISADHHPVTGVPAFFVHPCLLGDALSGFQCSSKNYLMVWLGLVGGCVGLWVPKEMAASSIISS